MNDLLLIVGMALVTFFTRYPVLVLVGRIPLPPAVFRALRYLPPAVLTAIVVPAVLMPAGTVDVSLNNSYLVAGIAAGLIGWRTQNLLLTIALGMGIFLGYRLLGGL